VNGGQRGIWLVTAVAAALVVVTASTSGWVATAAGIAVCVVIVAYVGYGAWLQRQPWHDDEEPGGLGTTTEGPEWDTIVAALAVRFPRFAAALRRGDGREAELGRGRDEVELRELEQYLGAPLPPSYRAFLAACGKLSLADGCVQMHDGHPFEHEFEPFEALSEEQQRRVRASGKPWPPESQGKLCFAEFFLEAAGDQVLFDLSRPRDGEWPVLYYAHEQGTVRELAPSVAVWIEHAVVELLESAEE
jgi:hypothetical protein